MSGKDLLPPVHPGEILKEEFLVPMGISGNQLATRIMVPAGRISEIIAGKRAITADTAFRLAKAFDMTPEFWINLQVHYDMEVAKQQLSEDIEHIRKFTSGSDKRADAIKKSVDDTYKRYGKTMKKLANN